MKTITIPDFGVTLEMPDPKRDAPFALGWFETPVGKETLLSMGNAEHEITTPSLQQQEEILIDFVELEKEKKQLTWIIRHSGTSIGAVWLELKPRRGVRAPSVHIMLGDHTYRNKGIGTAAMNAVINFAFDECHYTTVYTRHLASNAAVHRMNQKLGFEDDGDTYADEIGLVWQNVKKSV